MAGETVTKKLDEASVSEVRAFLHRQYGIETAPEIHKTELLTMFRTVHNGSTIDVPVTATAGENRATSDRLKYEPPAGPDAVVIRADTARFDPLVLLTIAEERGDGGSYPVALGHNGRAFWVPRGRACLVPWRYFCILRDCVMTEHEHDLTVHPPVYRERQVQMYPHTTHTMPDRAIVDAWDRGHASMQGRGSYAGEPKRATEPAAEAWA